MRSEKINMKVGYLITGLGTGGAEKHLLKLLPELPNKKFIVSLTKNNQIGKLIEKKGIKIYYLNLNLVNAPVELIKLINIFKKEKPEIIDTYLIHSNLIGRFIGKFLGIKVLNSVRNNYSYSKVYSRLDKYTSRLVDLYLPNSKALKSYLKSINIPNSKIKFIPNGVDITEYSKKYNRPNYRKKLKIPLKSKVIINVARFVPQKNQELVIDGFQKHLHKNPDSYLLFVGEGPTLNYCKQLVKSKKISNIKFLKNRKDVDHLLNMSDIFVLASIREGMSNALLEAMYFGKCCIVSNIPENKVLIDKYCGLTFSNPESLGKSLDKCDIKTIKNLGNKAKSKVLKEYSMKRIRKQYLGVIQCAE